MRCYRSPFLIKLFSWEYWPIWVVYFPLAFYWLYLWFRTGSVLFFSTVNPSIFASGMFGESKWDIFKIIPTHLYPRTVFVEKNYTLNEIKNLITKSDFQYPFIAKPDIGERGFMVSKIESENDLINYLKNINVAFLIQDFVHLPLELSVFYYRYPNQKKGVISSLTIKEMLSIRGDGYDTFEDLILNYPRAFLQWPVLKEKYKLELPTIPENGTEIELISIGNHCKGTTFIDGCHFIDKKLTNVFDKISNEIDGFYYGRYDLRCRSITELKNGCDFMILELNGAGAEPSHIYQPGFSILKAYKVLFNHFDIMATIALQNHKKGLSYMTVSNFFIQWSAYRTKILNV